MAGSPDSALLWQFTRSPAPFLVPLDISGGYQVLAILMGTPWRGLSVGLAVGTAIYGAATLLLADADKGMLIFVCFVVVVGAFIGVELLNRRDVLTPTHLVRQSGLLGQRRNQIPLQAVLDVEYSYPRWGRMWNVGDIDIRTTSGGLTLVAVHAPAEGAQRLLDARAALVMKEEAGRGHASNKGLHQTKR